MPIDDTTAAGLDAAAFAMFAGCYPHEACAKYYERFWAHFHERCPNVSREEMEAMLADTLTT